MSIRWLAMVCAVALAPAGAFIFVPQRGGVEPHCRVSAPASTELAADRDANLYLRQGGRLTALDAAGRPRWTWSAPEGFSLGEAPQLTDTAVVVVARNHATPAEAYVACLAPRGEGGHALERWHCRGLAVPPDGVYVPRDPEGAELGRVAVVTGDCLAVLRLSDGGPIARLDLGPVSGSPVWRGSAALVPVADPASVVGVRLDEPTTQSMRRVTLPKGEQVRSIRWDGTSNTVVIQGTDQYLARFVLVPIRGPEPGDPVALGARALAAADDSTVYRVADGRVEARATQGYKLLWRRALPPGGQPEQPPVPAGDWLLLALRDGETVHLVTLASATGAVVWQAEAKAVPAGGVAVPVNPDGRPYGVVAVLSGERLVVRELTTGAVRGERLVGTPTGAPLWVGESGFVPTKDGYREGGASAPAVVGFDTLSVGRTDDSSARWVWRVPEGEAVERLEWLPDGKVLVIRGHERAYLFE